MNNDPTPRPPGEPSRPDAGEDDLVRCTIYTRRQDAAVALAAGLAERIETVEAWVAAGFLAGFGVDGATTDDVARQLAAFAAHWVDTADLVGYRIPTDSTTDEETAGEPLLVWTSLAPAESWVEVEQSIEDGLDRDLGRSWMVMGAGIASSRAAAAALAAHAHVYRLSLADRRAMPTVTLDRTVETDAYIAAGLARQRGIPVAAIDRAYGVLRATGLPVNWETLLACAAGITGTTPHAQDNETST